MDFLKNQAAKIREQLAGLTPSQRMLAGSLAVIMVMTLMWWTRYAGTAETEDLYSQDLSPEEIASVSASLDTHGIPKKVVGNRIQVPSERKMEAMSRVQFDQAGPRDISGGFDAIYDKMNSPWNPSDTQSVMFNRAKEATLAQIMREWPGVRDARIVINNAQRRAFGEASVMPSATVNIKMKSGGEKPATKRLIEAAADTVAGAVSGMIRSKVSVIIDGASHSVQDRDADGNGGGDTWMELVKEHERYFSTKIQDHLRWLEGVYVTVSVDPKTQQSILIKESYDKKGTLSIPQTTRERTDENSTNSRPPGEPGAVPNTGVANQGLSVSAGTPGAAGGGGEGTVSNTSETETKNVILPSWVHETIKSPAGASAVVGASVSIPRSYFARIFKTATGSAKDPDEATLAPFITAEINRIKPMVTACLSQTPEDKVSVEWYWDALPSVDLSAQPAAATSLPLALTGHMKEIGIGALAVISLFMVSMMVRKGSPAPIITPQSEKSAAPSKNQEDLIGEVGEGIQSMDAVEIDDDSVKTEQMVSQVATMVKENPDGAASLVKRWLNRA